MVATLLRYRCGEPGVYLLLRFTVDANGGRAILTVEKGTPGERAFGEAFAAWGEASPPIVQSDNVDNLDRGVVALYDAGRYAEAIPLAQQVLAIREKTLAPITPMSQRR